MKIDASGLHYRTLNDRINAAVEDGTSEIELENVCGHRYIGAGLGSGVHITINGTPGNDLASFMNGAEITVNGNAQDGVGNTMNEGKVVIHGDAGDIPAHSMRGGKIFVRGLVGYRAGIHMKAFRDRVPVLVVGRTAGDYAGEYMAGGVMIILNLDNQDSSPAGNYLGTGMHGGAIFMRGQVDEFQLGQEVGLEDMTDEDRQTLNSVIEEYAETMNLDLTIGPEEFIKLIPRTTRPYGKLYAY